MNIDLNKARDIFIESVGTVPPEDWDAFIAAKCGEDAELHRHVQRLLEAHRQAGSFLEKPADDPRATRDFVPSPAPDPPAEAPGPVTERAGTIIGPYKLLQQLGEGGMGTVWVADQSEPVKRRVAVKVIKPGMDSAQVIRRFEAERQALAMMEHANIAKVFDAGTTLEGRPYFVMELVKGIPITKFCDREHLSPKERLELFIPVCQAVQHAHQKGIIHRDLKPSNVLIGLYDGQPIPKVIDFGVAKATGQKLTEHTIFTEVGQIVGTLEYMSPEQAELNNLDIDTRSDIYSLGVILYELLTGSPPFTSKQLRGAAFAEMLRMIREDEPPKPSTKLSSSDELPSIAANRHLEPKKLTKLVHGDLDWIAMKCLAKERARRYETANGLAMDIQRYLADEPVQAGPPSASYRVGKFLRRNRGPVTAAALVFLALVGGVIGTTMGMFQAQEARRAEAERADGERKAKLEAQAAAEAERRAKDESQKRLRQIEKANEIISAIFRNLDPWAEEKEGRPLRAILGDRLDQAVAQLEGEATGDALTVAQLQERFAESLLGLGRVDQAILLLGKSCETRTRLLGPDHLDTLDSMNTLADAYRQAGRTGEAIQLNEQNVKQIEAKLGADHPGTQAYRSNLANAYRIAGRAADAVRLHEQNLTILKSKLGPHHPQTMKCQSSLAVAYLAAGRTDEALPLLEEALRFRETESGSDHPTTVTTRINLAEAYLAAGRTNEAVKLHEESLKQCEIKLGSDHPRTLLSRHNLAEAYRRAGRADDAIRLHEENLKYSEAKFGSNHRETFGSLNALGKAYLDAGRTADSLRVFEDALPRCQVKLGPDDRETLALQGGLAAAYRIAGRTLDAIRVQDDNFKRYEAKLGSDHPYTLSAGCGLGLYYYEGGRNSDSIRVLEDNLKRRRAKLGSEHIDTVATMNNLALAYRAAGRAEEALVIQEKVAKGLKNTLGIEHQSTQIALDNLGVLYRLMGRLQESIASHEEALKFMKAKLGASHPTTLICQANLAGAYSSQRQFAQAASLAEDALAQMRSRMGNDHPKTLGTMILVARIHKDQGKNEDAERLILECVERLGVAAKKSPVPGQLPLGNSRFKEACDLLIELYDAWGKKDDAAKWRKELEAQKK